MCSHQPTVGLVVLKIKQNIFSAQTATAQAADTLPVYRDFPD
jgi:hypothetical protein